MRAQPQAGQTIVEFALAIGFILTMTLGMLDFGRVFYAHVGLTNAAREGARRATLLLTCTNPVTGANLTAVQTRVKDEALPDLVIDDSMINVDCSQSDRRTVSIVYRFQLASPFLDPLVGDGTNTGRVRLSTWATMPVMN